MAGGQFMSWLQSNPGIMQGIQTAVGGALGGIGGGNKNDNAAPIQRAEVAPTPPANNNMIMYLGIAAVAVFFLMKKK